MLNSTNWTGIFFGFAIAVLAAFHQFKLPPVLPELIGLYGYDEILAGGFMSIYAVAGFLLATAFGNRMQRHGTAPFLYLATALLLLGSGLTLAFPESGWMVLLGRGVEGVGACILSIAGPALATQHASAKDLHLSAAITATWVPLGAVFGAGLAFTGSALGLAAEWPLVWNASLLLTALVVVMIVILRRTGRIDFALPTAAGGGAGESDPWNLSRNRLLMRLAATVFLFWGWQNLAFMTWMPTYLVSALELSRDKAALIFLLPVVFIGIFNLAAAPLLKLTRSITGLLVIAVAGQAAMLVLMPFLGAGMNGLLCLTVYGACAGIAPTCLYNLPGSIFGRRGGTRAFGWLITGRNFGVFCGPLSAAAIAELTGSWLAVPWLVTTITLVAVALAVILHVLRRPEDRLSHGTSL